MTVEVALDLYGAGLSFPVAQERPGSTRVDLAGRTQMTRVGRNRNGWFGVSNGNKQTFVHGDCQRQPSTPSGPSAFWTIWADVRTDAPGKSGRQRLLPNSHSGLAGATARSKVYQM